MIAKRATIKPSFTELQYIEIQVMVLSWNEMKDQVLNFSKKWEESSNEETDINPFLVVFFTVFGFSSKLVSTIEDSVNNWTKKTVH